MTPARGNLASPAEGNSAPDREADPGRKRGDMTPVQAWLVETIRATAAWRWSVAERYPDDARNRNSASALEDAARILSEMSADSGFLVKLQRVVDILGDSPAAVVTNPVYLPRFGFERAQVRPDVYDVDRIVMWFYSATLQRYRDLAVEGEFEMPAELELLLEEAEAEYLPAPADDVDEVAELEQRLARVEQRLSRLERQLGA